MNALSEQRKQINDFIYDSYHESSEIKTIANILCKQFFFYSSKEQLSFKMEINLNVFSVTFD